MADVIKSDESRELSSDINVITAEINAYQRVAGEAIFEIGRRLKHVKENDLVHGEWTSWCEKEIGMTIMQANKFIKVFDEVGEGANLKSTLGIEALYQIATLPPEERDITHELPSGETKKPEDMTVRELRELKKALREAEQQAELERKERERLERENEELANQEPKIIVEKVEKEAPYDRMLDEPYSVERGNAFYNLMKDVDELYKKYAYLKDATEELRGLATYDDDLRLKYQKANDFWRMLNEIFEEESSGIIDAEIIEIN